MGDNGRQDLGKAGTPSDGRQAKARPRKGDTASNVGTHAGILEDKADKTSGRRAHRPTQADMWGVKGRQDVRKADAPSNTGTHVGRQWEIMGDKEREETLGR